MIDLDDLERCVKGWDNFEEYNKICGTLISNTVLRIFIDAARAYLDQSRTHVAVPVEVLRSVRDTLEHAKPIVKSWCHYQGDNKMFHADMIKPVDDAIKSVNQLIPQSNAQEKE